MQYVYELRHLVNCSSIGFVARQLNITEEEVDVIYASSVEGKFKLADLLSKDIIVAVKEHARVKLFNEVKRNTVEYKNQLLISDLYAKRKTFCGGLGTNKVKRRLTKIAIQDLSAKIVRLALEIEDKNVQAKDSSYAFKKKIYEEKHELILQLAEIYRENNLIFGVQEEKGHNTSHIIYFEIDEYQVSWHSNLSNKEFPKYEKSWDGLVNSTMSKIEILSRRILEKYKKL